MQPEMTEHVNGTKYWYLNDKLHREDGPAVEWADGSMSWWLNGKLHREDGPAIEHANGDKFWYLNGKEVDQLMFWITTKERLTQTQKNIILTT